MNNQYYQQPMYDTTEATASYGRFKTYTTSFVMCFVILSMCCIGGFVLNASFSSPTNMKKTIGIVIDISNGYKVRYTINNKNYENIIQLSIIPRIGQVIDIYYNNDNPDIIQEVKTPKNGIGIGFGLICTGLCLFVIISMNLYSVHKYKTAAINSALTPTVSPTYSYRNRGFINPAIVL